MNHFTPLAIQSWILYSISISLIFTRITFRRIMLRSFKKLQADDWLMLSVVVPYTASIIVTNQIGWAESEIERKYRYVLEEMQIVTIWLVKACLLVLYWRICPKESSTLKRRLLKGILVFSCTSFFVVQLSLMLWCHPTEAYWNTNKEGLNSQCFSYHNHSALTLAFNIPDTIFIMLMPIPFIPTTRRPLLAILLLIGTFVLITDIVSRSLVIVSHISSAGGTPSLPKYLPWYTSESTLGIIFANLPFLTSLVVTAAPARIRHFSDQLSLSQWPRSRRTSWDYSDVTPPLRTSRFNSTATTLADLVSPTDVEKAENKFLATLDTKGDKGDISGSTESSPSIYVGSSEELLLSHHTLRPETRDSQVPKMRLSGGLAEMGGMSLQDTTQGWPIYWK
ncbi:hypothetical protein GQ44DRAFT_771823 [Phaeosphaeriaceae sp. PMI808]|nr:hypothetical protein GQ44DRAFT_771823 [Phaeosphaeriaceae sp. PMI808]